MMAMMGYKAGIGLGKNKQGIAAPVATTPRPKNAGLGSIEGFKENLPPPPHSAKKEQQRWSKKAISKKSSVLTKTNLLVMRGEQEQDEQSAIVQKVIDMRGRQLRVLTDLKVLNVEHEMEANDLPMPELHYNVSLLVDEAKAGIVRLNMQLRRVQEKVASLVREGEKVGKQEALQKQQSQVMETIAEMLEQVRVDDTAGVLSQEGLLKTFQELKDCYVEEFMMCSILWIACRFAHPGDQAYDLSCDVESMSPYEELVCEVILPAGEGTNPCVGASMVVDARTEDRYLVPFYSIQLSSFLHVWQTHDASAYAVSSPWKDVFDAASWEDLIVRYIIPKLKMALQEFQINSANQELDQFNWVMIWASAIPVHHMVHMLEVDFFSKWQQDLYHWLCSPNPDFNEIMNWYKGWKGLFRPESLANERIRMLLTGGLDMMNRAAEGLEVVQPGARENVGYLRATEKRQFDAAQQASEYMTYHAVPGAAMVDLSFKESIQAYAMDQGSLFMRRVGKFYNGMPVYEFGTCIDSVKRLLYARLQEGIERWSAVSLTQLMEMNRKA
uniref:G-patch domain-containing protein n=1 Tax=Oryza punctata TaxID=4537 RepID=A0A0E0MPH1_ORYPU